MNIENSDGGHAESANFGSGQNSRTNVVSAMDYREHENTYANFLVWTKWTVIFLTLLLLGLAWLFFGLM